MVFKYKIVVFIIFIVLAIGLSVFSCNEQDDDDDDDNEGDDDVADDDATDDDVSDDDSADDDDTADDDSTDDDDTADDDVTDDDDDATGEVIIENTENSDCKNTDKSKGKYYWPQDILFDFQNGKLIVTHVNGEFNCCIDYIATTVQLNGLIIDLYEVEVASAPCFCVCPFDVTTTLSGLASGTYTVNIYANGDFAVSGQTTIP